MEPSDWTDSAENYNEDVLSVYDHDHEGRVRSLIKEHRSPYKLAVDLGCGPGKFLPLLSRHFGRVHACDYSEEMLKVASHRIPNESTTSEQCDLRKAPPNCGPADFALCLNTILHPGLEAREKIWRNVSLSISPDGILVLVLPSLESALLSRHRLLEWNLQSGVPASRAHIESFEPGDPGGKLIARTGILDAGGTLTKHYLREEIECTLSRFGLRFHRCEKLTYSWKTEFKEPPDWMQAPYPWDWLVVASRTPVC